MKAHLLGTSLKAIGFVLLILSAGIENAAYGGPIPALIDFDNDVPGSPPAIGGVNEPTSLDVSANTSVLVQSASNGINTQPVVLDEGGTGDFVSVNYALSAPVSSGLLRVEATISLNRFFSGHIFFTSVGTVGAVVNRLQAISDGTLQAEVSGSGRRPLLGSYTPNQPFRVRMDIDIQGGVWSFVLDDELNGFLDDPVIRDLPFVNDLSVLPNVGAVSAGLNVFSSSSGTLTTVAYDDISILIPPKPTDLEILKTVDNATPIPNESVEFTIQVANVGDETASDVHVQDLLPSDLAIPVGMAAFPSIGSYDPMTGDWSVGNLDPAVSAVLTLPAMVVSANPPSCIINEASTSLLQDPNADNDTASAAIRQAGIERCVELDVDFGISVGPLITLCNQEGRYSGDVDVTNHGPDAARNVVVSMTEDPVVGPNLRFDDADCSNLPASQCNITEIAAGETVTIDVTSDLYQSDQPSERTFAVSATTSDTDYDPSNNSPSVTGSAGGFSQCSDLGIDVPIPVFGDEGGGGGCFIATAAYGSALDPHVKTLRQFRDRYLVTNRTGRIFVDFYYRHSPPIADYIASRQRLRAVVRAFLTPLVLSVAYPWSAFSSVSLLILISIMWSKRTKKGVIQR